MKWWNAQLIEDILQVVLLNLPVLCCGSSQKEAEEQSRLLDTCGCFHCARVAGMTPRCFPAWDWSSAWKSFWSCSWKGLQSGYCSYMKHQQRSTVRRNVLGICDMLWSSSNMPPSCASPLLDSPAGEWIVSNDENSELCDPLNLDKLPEERDAM